MCGGDWCTYDTSAWVAMPLAYKSKNLFAGQNETAQLMKNLNSAFKSGSASMCITVSHLGGHGRNFSTLSFVSSLVGGPLPGNGLRSISLAEIKISSNFEPFWKSVLGVGSTSEC